MAFKEKQHGGSTNVDIESLKYAMERWGVKSMLDIGCGTGGQVIEGQKLGIDSYGVDGSKDIPNTKNFQQVDYRVKASSFDREFDLGWSVEFVEHVEEKCIPIFMKDFQKCKRVILTAAPPFWGGKNHVNEQSEIYWIHKFQEHGFSLNFEETFRVRNVSVTLMNGEVRPVRQQFVKIRGLVFERNDVV
jgi:SAM-dependent methyltransferase